MKLRRLVLQNDPISSLESAEIALHSLSTATKIKDATGDRSFVLCSRQYCPCGQIYAVLTNGQQRISATAGLPSGIFQVNKLVYIIICYDTMTEVSN